MLIAIVVSASSRVFTWVAECETLVVMGSRRVMIVCDCSFFMINPAR